MRSIYLVVMGITLGLGDPVPASVSFTGSYTQNFNGMALGTAIPADWFVGGLAGTDGAVDSGGNGAITGTSVQVDNGSVAAGSGTIGNYNYGATGDAASRSLGSIATTSRGHRAMEVRLSNMTGFAIGSFEVRYDGKQWRVENNAGDQALVMKFSTDGVNFVTMGAAFDFHSIQDTGTTGPLDGNTVRLNGIGGVYSPPVPINPGATFYLRWFDFNDSGVADHGLAIDNVTVSNPVAASGTSLSFQDQSGVYSGTVDTFLQQAVPTANNAALSPIEWDGEDAGGVNYALIRFDGIFGSGAGQVKPTDVITSATLILTLNDAGNAGTVHEILTPWAETDTFNTFGGEPDVQADEYGPAVGSMPGAPVGMQSVDVTASIAAWNASGNPSAANLGWIIRPSGTDGVQFRSREHATASERPRLVVLVNGGTPAQKTLQVKHQPYLQLGNAPLVSTGPGIGTTDQMVIVWQTVESGSGTAPNDYFEVEYRPAGAGGYTPVSPIATLNIGEGTRVNHSATISGLSYDSDFEYRVHHRRNPSSPVLVSTYNGTFHTRKHPSSNLSFTFAAHGDSATIHSSSELAQFESVNARMTAINPAFVMLLGDNVYDSGTHTELDARLDGSLVPINSALIRNRIEYFCMGNHDAGTLSGLPSLQNYYCPIPALGITSPVAPPAGETPEKNYSFDYGNLHIAVIDSTAWGGPGNSVARANAITAWLDADLAASTAPWKIVAAHHPPKSNFGHSDTGQGMAAQLVPVLVNRGVDLLLVGHSHNYQRSFPLTGYSGSDVTYDIDPSGAYTKGARVIEVVAGTGGRNIDCCAPTSATQWLARAFGSNNGGQVGPFIIDVTPTQLTCKYTLAGSGAILDQFTISVPGPTIAVNPASLSPAAFVGSNAPDGSFSVSNSGTGTITYTITDNADWLSVSPDNGTSTGEADTITVSYDTAALAIGTHHATITVTAPEALNSPRTLPVTLTIETVWPDFDHDADVDMTDFAVLQNCLTGTNLIVVPECVVADIAPRSALDGRVDGSDLQVFLKCLAGADILPDPTCDD